MSTLTPEYQSMLCDHIADMFPTLSGEDQVRLQNFMLTWSEHIQAQDEAVKGARRLNMILLQRLGGSTSISRDEIETMADTERLHSHKDPVTDEVKVWVTSQSRH